MKGDRKISTLEEELIRAARSPENQKRQPAKLRPVEIPINPHEYGLKAAQDVSQVFKEALAKSK